MIWDEGRWHSRFALFPKWIGTKKVWLEWYAWRIVPPIESKPIFKAYPPPTYVMEVREYVIRSSEYVTWRFTTAPLSVLVGASYAWMERPYIERAKLAVVQSRSD